MKKAAFEVEGEKWSGDQSVNLTAFLIRLWRLLPSGIRQIIVVV